MSREVRSPHPPANSAASLEKRVRHPQQTRAHILEVAFREVTRRGFQGVSLNEIIEKTAVTKGAFFHHFATKQELGYALVDELLRTLILDTWVKPLAAYHDPVQGILQTLRENIEAVSPDMLAAGCPLNNLTQEMSAVDPLFRGKLLDITLTWISEIERYLKLAQERGTLRADYHARQLAEFIVTVHEGSIGLAKSMQDRSIMRSLHASLAEYLRLLRP